MTNRPADKQIYGGKYKIYIQYTYIYIYIYFNGFLFMMAHNFQIICAGYGPV